MGELCPNAAPLLEVKGETKMTCVDFLLLDVFELVKMILKESEA
jgi:hypothetical protein